MFKNNFVASIKCDGKILREQDNDTVLLPFLSEYSILLWNKDSRKASVSVEIDGVNITHKPIILKGNEKFDLERFFDNTEPTGRKFRFIEMTKKIEEYRGIQPADGLVRVSFIYEQVKPVCLPLHPNPYEIRFGHEFSINGPTTTPLDNHKFTCQSSTSNQTTKDKGIFQSVSNHVDSNSIAFPDTGRPLPDIAKSSLIDGIKGLLKKDSTGNKHGMTVKGSESSQKLPISLYGFQPDLSTETVIIFQLFGNTTNNTPIKEAVTKKSTKSCPTCGDKWQFDFTYCPSDATFLVA